MSKDVVIRVHSCGEVTHGCLAPSMVLGTHSMSGNIFSQERGTEVPGFSSLWSPLQLGYWISSAAETYSIVKILYVLSLFLLLAVSGLLLCLRNPSTTSRCNSKKSSSSSGSSTSTLVASLESLLFCLAPFTSHQPVLPPQSPGVLICPAAVHSTHSFSRGRTVSCAYLDL